MLNLQQKAAIERLKNQASENAFKIQQITHFYLHNLPYHAMTGFLFDQLASTLLDDYPFIEWSARLLNGAFHVSKIISCIAGPYVGSSRTIKPEDLDQIKDATTLAKFEKLVTDHQQRLDRMTTTLQRVDNSPLRHVVRFGASYYAYGVTGVQAMAAATTIIEGASIAADLKLESKRLQHH